MPCVRSTRWIGCYPSSLQKSGTFLAKGVMTIPSPELKEGSFPARMAFIMERSSARVLAEARMKRGELFIPSMTSTGSPASGSVIWGSSLATLTGAL